MKNLKEFIALIYKYKSITIDEIKTESSKMTRFKGGTIANTLSGFGWNETCSLCCALRNKTDYFISEICLSCVYGRRFGCFSETYSAIEEAETPDELLTAFRERAAYMREFLKNKNISIE